MSRHWITPLIHTSLASTVACCSVAVSFAVVFSLQPAIGEAAKPHSEEAAAQSSPRAQTKKATTKLLGGADRYLTLISTDKPIYRAGEKVYVRGVLLNAANHKPLANGQSASANVEIKGPKGDVVHSGNVIAQDSIWGFAWDVPKGQAGGEYTLRANYPWDGHAPAERKFDIRAYRAPRLKSQITFLRDGYGPGEKVNATLDVKRAEGGVPEGAKVTVIARVDGMEIKGETAKVSANGLCSVSFDLPLQIPRGEGTLALVIEDGGVVETASKTIPILLQTLDLQIFPEGGDLLAGYSNRVYVQARQPNGKPADLVAKLMSKQQSGAIAEFRTVHEGRGRFEFTPESDKSYYLSISQPAGIKTLYPLPRARSQGAVVRTDKDVFDKGQPVTVRVGCTDACDVTLSKREVEIAHTQLNQSADRKLQSVSFTVPASVDGVLTVTVWDRAGNPLAERLVMRQPANPLNISIKADKKSYVPGDQAKLTVKATDVHGKPVSAVVGVTVTDDSVLEMVEKREQAPRLPVMLFLEPEVKDLADAHVYLDPNNPKAPLASDLLLGTQGWRRFALMELAKFIEANGDQARRAVALKMPSRYELARMKDGAMGGHRAFGMVPAPPAVVMSMQAMEALPMLQKAQAEAQPVAKAPAMDLEVGQKDQLQDKKRLAAIPPGDMNKNVVGDADEELQQAIEEVGKKEGKMAFAPGFRASRAFFPNGLVVVREFAHRVREGRKPTDRVDFAETLYWNTGVKTNATTGEATLTFGLNDSVSTFRVFADGFAGDGAIGAANVGVESVQPFYAEAKLPLEVTSGDRVLLPISLVNATAGTLAAADAKVNLKGDFDLLPPVKGVANLAPGARVRWVQPIKIGIGNGQKEFILNAKAGSFQDKVTRQLSVKPKGFPIETTFGGIIEPDKTVTHIINIAKDVAQGSMVSNTAVYPTPLANMTGALERMIQDPYGCFEQTSSTSYPLTMAQQYFVSHTGVDPKLVETSRQKLDAGYKKLVGFWCPDRGYEWFGENPGHEALTAFGLLHFTDMAKVREVDQTMIGSTRSWLLKQKDGKGGFSRKRRSLHTWIEDKDCSNAYITWALLESDQKPAELKAELDSLKTAATASKNSYVVALAASALDLSGEKADARKLMDRLAAKQKSDGSVDGITGSIVGSSGESLEVEGTALATLAWLRDPAYASNVEKSIKYLADSCKGGRYGSTQATVLALRAIVNYDKQRARPKAPGKVQVYVDGQAIGDWVAFTPSTQGSIKLPDLSELLSAGEHKLELRMQGGGAMPYSMAVKYNTITPASDKECKVDIAVKMAQVKVVEGAATEANVTVINKANEVIPNPVAIVGLPGGMEPRHDQLKELVKKGKIDAYEVLGREVVLYWRALPASAKVEVPISLIAAVPGSYTGPASRAYLYYTDEHKHWVDGVKVEIAAK